MTPKERAEKSAAAMWDNDKASKWVGMAITNVDEGVATLELQVQDHHCNGHGICHGGAPCPSTGHRAPCGGRW